MLCPGSEADPWRTLAYAVQRVRTLRRGESSPGPDNSATIHLKRFTEDLGIELSSVRLREHFVRFNKVLPGSGTLLCRTTLREMEDSYQHIDKDKALLVVEGESQISKVKLFKNLMFQLNFGALKLIFQLWTF